MRTYKDRDLTDDDFGALRLIDFNPDHTLRRKKKVWSITRPAFPSPSVQHSLILQALVIPSTITPSFLNIQPLNIVNPNMTF